MTARIPCLALLWLATACTAEEAPDYYANPTAENPAPVTMNNQNSELCVDAPAYEELSALNTCVMCHSSARTGPDRKSAPVTINFDTEAGAQAAADRALNMVMVGAMPPNSTGLKLTDADKQQLYAWVMCSM